MDFLVQFSSHLSRWDRSVWITRSRTSQALAPVKSNCEWSYQLGMFRPHGTIIYKVEAPESYSCSSYCKKSFYRRSRKAKQKVHHRKVILRTHAYTSQIWQILSLKFETKSWTISYGHGQAESYICWCSVYEIWISAVYTCMYIWKLKQIFTKWFGIMYGPRQISDWRISAHAIFTCLCTCNIYLPLHTQYLPASAHAIFNLLSGENVHLFLRRGIITSDSNTTEDMKN
jgi:hypothetical protein